MDYVAKTDCYNLPSAALGHKKQESHQLKAVGSPDAGDKDLSGRV
ncbi:hypothetical protein [Coleofasciculus sp. E2-BRE-01]